MMNLAPQGPSLKCMVQEFAVPIVVGPSRESSVQHQPQPHKPVHLVVGQWLVSGHLLSNSALAFCPACLPVLLPATLQDCTAAAPATVESSLCGTATSFVGSLK